MHNAPFASLVQIREHAGTAAAISDPSNDDVFREEVQQALGRAGKKDEYLEKLHIFVLAHAMRRPIVVYHYASGEPRGSLISGIYLPDLWGELGERDGCSRVPLCLVYTGVTATGQGHFTACVGAEGHALVLPLSDHVHGERLLIRYGPDHVDIRPAEAVTLVDTPTAGPTDSWAAHAALHLELTSSAASDSGDSGDLYDETVAPARVRRFPFAFVSRTPADSRLMLRSVAELRDQFVAEVTRSAVELRIAPDGVAYTKIQFVEFYGGTREWDEAAPFPDPKTEQPMVPKVMRQSTIATEMETLWTAKLINLFVEELKPIISGSSQSEGKAILYAAEAEIQRLEYPVAQSGVFGTPDAMVVVFTLQVPSSWRKGATLVMFHGDERIELVAPDMTQPGDMVRITLPRRTKPPPGGAPPSPIDAPHPLGSAMPTTAPPPPPDTAPFPQVQSPGDLQGLLEGATSMEDLYGIAQNIIRLKLTHYERVQKARDDFHERCAKFGADEATFSGLFDICDEALRHADDGACAGGADVLHAGVKPSASLSDK